MKRRTHFLILAALILGAVYAYKFTDWFQEDHIQIKFRSLVRPGTPSGNTAAVTFYLDKQYEVTSLKVISVDEALTNKYPHALWHLVAENISAPVTAFSYGIIPPGMKPKIEGLKAEPLVAEKKYKVLVEVGKLRAEKEFQVQGRF